MLGDEVVVDTNPVGAAALLALDNVAENWCATIDLDWGPVETASLVGQVRNASGTGSTGSIQNGEGVFGIAESVNARVECESIGDNQGRAIGLVALAISGDIGTAVKLEVGAKFTSQGEGTADLNQFMLKKT